ncbi:HAMP domain-containing histidine kinase [Bradyrhizobium sp. BRP22]|uniref:sensor histidine kinase n=1 Tax=Bradyrhizobium sp. BRP22 TaxID=2793821 RepID=UPI001CD3705F|nr:HAMP domain-containing sensor histidine kinase [Bradyrhizobium sp. BRP22]MCA1452554.1 HAMP domain-containing histidine kinase [Bradyrhizobium sp. BRP22]
MTSITRTLTISVGMVAAVLFVITFSMVVWFSRIRGSEHVVCPLAAATLKDATTIDANGAPIVRSTSRMEQLKSHSPAFWYVVSSGTLKSEFGSEHRPPLPFSIPYNAPVGLSVLDTLDQTGTFCLAVVQRGPSRLAMMIGGARPGFVQMARSVISRNFSSIFLVALAFASIVAIGALLTARLVSGSIRRVTKLALAIDPTAPQGSIALAEVPIELRPLVQALNRAFDEIDAYIRMQRRFLGNAAHQLRTPLTVLRAKIEDVPEPALKADLVRDLRRLTSLVSAMLDLARLQNHTIEKRPFDLAVVTRDVLADFSPSALDAGIELSLEESEGITIVLGVEAAVRSALANLVGNALIHACGAQRIVARLSHGSVSISDDGAGISPSFEQDLVEPFQTGNPSKEGAGLGLAIVREIMGAHGGELIITSSPGAGTTACLRFPEAVAGTPREAKLSLAGAPAAAPG